MHVSGTCSSVVKIEGLLHAVLTTSANYGGKDVSYGWASAVTTSLPLLFSKMVELVQPVLSFCFFYHAA